MKTPLLASLILAVYRKTKSKLPENKIRLYQMFVELLAGGWDAAKNLNRASKFGPATKITVLTRLAGALQAARTRECTDLEIGIAIRDVLPGLIDQKHELVSELLQDGLLLRTCTKYTFAHQSFQEFLAAGDIADVGGKRASRILQQYLVGDDWWLDVIKFYMGRSTRPQDIVLWIKGGVNTIAAEERVEWDYLQDRGARLLQEFEKMFPGYVAKHKALKER